MYHFEDQDKKTKICKPINPGSEYRRPFLWLCKSEIAEMVIINLYRAFEVYYFFQH